MVKWTLLALVGCQSHDHAAPRVETGSAVANGSDGRAAHAGEEPDEPHADARVKVDEPEPAADPGKQIYDLGALPAWQAGVDRSSFLERRGQHGVVYGTLGEPITLPASGSGDAALAAVVTPYAWLIDDTEGNGALAIRVLPGRPEGKPGDRIAFAGAWALDEQHHYFWKASLATPLAPASPSKLKDPAAVPGHAIVNGELPSGARPIGLAKENDAAYFTVVGSAPLAEGDGWLVADELGSTPYALLNMPGERASFGAQDLRTADERWSLRRGQTYWVRLGPIHKHGADKPATITARTPPVRVK
ncbi:hypothetical protein BH11MYX1_BH11MYX1_49040 [soil metagenome]